MSHILTFEAKQDKSPNHGYIIEAIDSTERGIVYSPDRDVSQVEYIRVMTIEESFVP